MSYRTKVELTDSDGMPAIHAAVEVETSEHALLEINGVVYDVWPGAPVSAATDPHGILTIVDTAVGVASPRITIRSDGLNEMSFDPSAEIKHAVAGKSAHDIATARMRDPPRTPRPIRCCPTPPPTA